MPDCIEGCTHDTNQPYTCNYCGREHCAYHRLPEKHGCSGIQSAETLGPDFRAEFDISTEAVAKTTPGECNTCGNDTEAGREICLACERIHEEQEKRSTCVNCTDHTPPGNDLCLRCRRKANLSESARSPDVALDGSIDRGDTTKTGRERDLRQLLPSISLGVVSVRIRSLFSLIVLIASFGVVLAGIYLMAIGRRSTVVAAEMSVHGMAVPELEVGGLYFRPDEVVSLIGVAFFMVGAGVIVKMTFGPSTHGASF